MLWAAPFNQVRSPSGPTKKGMTITSMWSFLAVRICHVEAFYLFVYRVLGCKGPSQAHTLKCTFTMLTKPNCDRKAMRNNINSEN